MPHRFTESLQALLGDAYRLDRELGGGGMSRVFVAREIALKRDVVVKVLPPELVSAESLRRFEHEIELTASLQHPHILPVLTAGAGSDILYYVTPYVSGLSLRRRLADGPPLGFDESLRLAGELLLAVAFAHARGFVHRDIKPANVLVSEGHAVLADFGIARALAGPDDGAAPSSTRDGASAYAAPEGSSNPTSDLFAVAAVLHEMLTGVTPSPGVKAEGIERATRARHPAAPMDSVRRVSRCIAAGLSGTAVDRPQTAAAFAALLARSTAPRSRRVVVASAVLAVAAFAVLATVRAPRLTAPLESAVTTASRGAPTPESAQDATAADSASGEVDTSLGPMSATPTAARSVADSARWLAEIGDITGALTLARVAGSAADASASTHLLHAMLATLKEAPDLPGEEPQAAIGRALSLREALHASQVELALAWQALAAQRYAEAAPRFRALQDTPSVRMWALLGLAETIARDNHVEPLAASPSGFAFRANWSEGVRVLAEALRVTPTADRNVIFSRLQRIRYIQEGRLRPGRGADSAAFIGRPEAVGDSVQFIPYPVGPRTFLPPPGPQSRKAYTLMRAELAPLVTEWRRESPDNSIPWVLTSALLEASGNIRVAGDEQISALDAMTRARRLARGDEERAQRDRDQLRLLLRAGDFAGAARHGREALRGAEARGLAEQDFLLPIAVVTGRLSLSVAMLQRTGGLLTRQITGPDGTPVALAPELHRARASFIVAAALGVCDETVRQAPARLNALADAQFPKETRAPWFDFALLQEPLEQSQSCTGHAPLARTTGQVRPINRAAAQLLAGDTAAVRTQFATMAQMRIQQGAPSSNPDQAVGEALMRAMVGDTAGALGVLKSSLEALSVHPERMFSREGPMGSIGRAMLLVAEWSAKSDPAVARRWIDGVDALWAAADAPLRAEVRRVRLVVDAGAR